MAVCYSKGLETTKRETIDKKVKKESEALEKLGQQLIKRSFACLEDAQLEIEKLKKHNLSKTIFHDVEFQIDESIIFII